MYYPTFDELESFQKPRVLGQTQCLALAAALRDEVHSHSAQQIDSLVIGF
jgi:hypothetical protein